jgi:hypothetical protein
MGKSAKRKQLEALKREFLTQHGDGRSEEARAQARAMLEKLQRKLDDDALREDGMVDSIITSRLPRAQYLSYRHSTCRFLVH